MTDGALISPCSVFYHRHDREYHRTGPVGYPFRSIIEKGTEAYYSGIRVVVIAKKADELEEAEVRRHRLIEWIAGKPVEIEPPQEGTENNNHALSVDGRPFYTIFFELVDWWSSTALQVAEEPSNPASLHQIPDTHKVLYESAECTTEDSPSCILCLATQLQYRLKPCKPAINTNINIDHTLVGRLSVPTHGFRILPPSERRPFFTQPPPEILFQIFSHLVCDGEYKYTENWQSKIVGISLVCRAWWRAALPAIYEDFGGQTRRKVRVDRLAAVLQDNPMWGKYIKQFSPYCSAMTKADTEIRGEALTILKTATNMRELWVGNVSPGLVGKFIEALCKMTALRSFIQIPTGPRGSEGRTYLNAAQLTKCCAHWSALRQIIVYQLGQRRREDETEFAPAKCSLHQITFLHGSLSITQLRAITASSQDTLHTVSLIYVTGITNQKFTSWLGIFGPNLMNLNLVSSIFTCSEEEELAVDATIHRMSRLRHLEVGESLVTVLTLLRFEPVQAPSGSIIISDPTVIDPHAFVSALFTTKWKAVQVPGLRISHELTEKAERVAKERGIDLSMRTHFDDRS